MTVTPGQIYGCSEGYMYGVVKVGNGRVRVVISGYGLKGHLAWIPISQMKDLRKLT